MWGVNASRTSFGQGQGQGQSSDIKNGQQLGNTNPNTNYILYQPNNSPSIIIGLDQNDESKEKKTDLSSSTSFTPNNSFSAPTTGSSFRMGLGDMINYKSSLLNMALPTLAAGGMAYLVGYTFDVKLQDNLLTSA